VMWFRGYLQDEHNIAAKDIDWVQAGLEDPGRRDKFPLNLPPGFPLESLSEETLTEMLADGRLDAVISARRPPCFIDGHPKVRRLFPDYRTVERDYYRRTGLFPIMHAVGIKRELVDKHRWLAASVYKAFQQAKQLAEAEFAESAALKIGLPWINAEYEETSRLMGTDFWPYGVAKNHKVLSAMARYSYEQGLAARLLTVEEMFAKGNVSETKV
jgi:4,5-dihydroxyphthalate decarboxylase